MTEPAPLPLFRWMEARHQRIARRRLMRRSFSAVAMLIAAVGASTFIRPAPRLLWNGSASAPIGLYRVIPGRQIERGDMVIAWLPGRARQWAAIRHYLPANVPLVKHVAGVGGDMICAFDRQITINGRSAALRLDRDRSGRPLTGWQGCFRLGAGQDFLLNAPSESFDGRYFGATNKSEIVGKAVLLWAR